MLRFTFNRASDQILVFIYCVRECDFHSSGRQGQTGTPRSTWRAWSQGNIHFSFLLFRFWSFVQLPKWVFYQITNNLFKDPLHCPRCVLANRMKETSRALCGMFSLCKVEKCMQQRFTLITAFKNENIFAYINLLTSFLKDCSYLKKKHYFAKRWSFTFLIEGFWWTCWTKRATRRTCE